MVITGQVMYNILAEDDEHRLGISFTRITKEDRQSILQFVKMGD
ncbi:MAG: hypothetical protein ABIH71_02595 [Candidatus Omnitrophota bacterium]